MWSILTVNLHTDFNFDGAANNMGIENAFKTAFHFMGNQSHFYYFNLD